MCEPGYLFYFRFSKFDEHENYWKCRFQGSQSQRWCLGTSAMRPMNLNVYQALQTMPVQVDWRWQFDKCFSNCIPSFSDEEIKAQRGKWLVSLEARIKYLGSQTISASNQWPFPHLLTSVGKVNNKTEHQEGERLITLVIPLQKLARPKPRAEYR